MNTISSVIIEAVDVPAAEKFYADAFGLGDAVSVRESDAATSGFRGFTLSLVVAGPSTLGSLFDSAIAAGATVINPIAKSLWGIGASLQAPDGAIWTIATSAKKDKGPATRDVDQVVLLIGAMDVAASKRFYLEHGLQSGKSFGSYVEFTQAGAVSLSLYKRAALAKNAGVPPEGSGSHRLAIVSDGGAFTDPDGFVWEAAKA